VGINSTILLGIFNLVKRQPVKDDVLMIAVMWVIKLQVFMVPLPRHRPKQISLGPLETEILKIIWQLGTATVKDVHDSILNDPNRELAYASVTTILNRLTKKGWLACDKQERSFVWQPLLSEAEAQSLLAYEQLNQFLAVGKPEIVAAFADSLDQASLEQLELIGQKLKAIREAREDRECI
jgi:predicted transcriptional regulator